MVSCNKSRIMTCSSMVGVKEDPIVKQRLEPRARRDRHVMPAIGADIQRLGQFAVKQHRAALIAFRPKILGHLAAREDRVDPGADVIGNPVHKAQRSGVCPCHDEI